MNDIERVIIRFETGETAQEAGKERLTATAEGIRYEFEPLMPSENNPRKEWYAEASGPEYGGLFEDLTKSVEGVIRASPSPLLREADLVTFTIRKTDGSREDFTCTLPDTEYMECFAIVDRMVKAAGTQRGV